MREHITVDLDSDEDGSTTPGAKTGDPGEGQRSADPQETPKASGDDDRDVPNNPTELPTSTSPIPTPPTIRRSACKNKGIAPICPDEDPKLQLGSKPPTEKVSSPVTQQDRSTSGGVNIEPDSDRDTRALYLTVDVLHSYQEAMGRVDADEWVAAITEEYHNLQWKGVFIEVECPVDVCVHEGRLVFAEKVGSDGDVTRKKVRLVAKGYMEVWGEDYWHTYSPTLGHNTLLSSLAYAAAHDLEIHQLDAVAAYLNSDLTEEIYLRPPDGVPTSPNMVWHLKKALYGLKQAGLEWYRTLQSHIKSIGYAQSGYDPCLYAHDSENFTVIYVDNLLLFAPKKQLVCTKLELAGKYEMCNLGEVHWFLMMEITHDRVARTITIDQWQYIWKILGRFGLSNVQPVSTPMAANLKLPKLETPAINQHLYQSMLGLLMYAAIRMRPDIMFAIHYLSQHSVTLGEEHLMAMKCVYQYLNGTLDLRLIYYGNRLNEDLMGFADLDWAGDPNSWTSVSRYAFMFCRAVVSWLAKKQPTIALSSTEAEYMAMTHARKEAVFLEHLYGDVGIPISVPIFLLIDNQSAIALAENPIFHARSKHIKVCHHWVHEKIKDGTIQLDYIPTADQVTDIFTKPLNSEKF